MVGAQLSRQVGVVARWALGSDIHIQKALAGPRWQPWHSQVLLFTLLPLAKLPNYITEVSCQGLFHYLATSSS